MKKPISNFQASKQQIIQTNKTKSKMGEYRFQKNFILQKIYTFFTKMDELNIEYISRKW